MSTAIAPVTADQRNLLDPDDLLGIMAKRNFANLATVSAGGWPHSAGVLYAVVGRDMFVSTELGTRKARNIAHEERVAVAIPVRRIPFAPPSLIHFQTTAHLCSLDDPHIRRLVAAGDLDKVTSHGELGLADGCFVRIAIPSRINTYGLGMSLYRFAKDPLNAVGVTHLPER